MRGMTTYLRLMLSLSFVGALGVGCGDDDDDEIGDRDDAGSRDGGAPGDAGIDASVRTDGGGDAALDANTGLLDAAARLSEAQVVGVAAAINAGEIEAGALARSKGTSEPVRDFATMMVMMHTAAQQRQTALGITPGLSSERTSIESSAATAQQMLTNTPAGPGFDLAYLESQVMMHTSALSLIDTLLLPSATSSALRGELTTTRGEVVMHLARARELVGLARDGGLPSADAGSSSDAGGLDAGG